MFPPIIKLKRKHIEITGAVLVLLDCVRFFTTFVNQAVNTSLGQKPKTSQKNVTLIINIKT